MKNKCDNDCGTCPMTNQIFCSLTFARENNRILKVVVEKLDSILQAATMLNGQTVVINPIENVSNDPAREQVEEGQEQEKQTSDD